jgi:hypothetical protein
MNLCCIIAYGRTSNLKIVILVFMQPTGCVFACLLVTWLVAFRDWENGFSSESFIFELDSTFSLGWMCVCIQIPLVMSLRPRSPGVRGQQVWNHSSMECT